MAEDDEPWSDVGYRYLWYGCFSLMVVLAMVASALAFALWLTSNVDWPW